MGLIISKFLQSFRALKDKKILMLGLDAAGKTTTLYKLKLGETVTTIPTIGFNVEGFETANNIRLTMWDVGGQSKVRKLWRHYFMGSHAVIFVIDSQDRERIAEAREELENVINSEDLCSTCKTLLIYANKQDLPNVMTTDEIVKALRVNSLRRDLEWYIQPCVATTGDGVYEGIDWLSRCLAKQ